MNLSKWYGKYNSDSMWLFLINSIVTTAWGGGGGAEGGGGGGGWTLDVSIENTRRCELNYKDFGMVILCGL